MGMFFSLSLPWWVFPQPDFMVVRGGHRIALFSLCFACLTSNLLCGGRCCHLCHSLLHASLEEEEFIQNRLTGNCPANILPLRGHRRYESFDTFCVHVENDFGVN